MKYVIATGAYDFAIIKLIHSKGLVTHTEHSLGGSQECTSMTYDFAQAQQVRDALIKDGADPAKIRIQYPSPKDAS